jgi:undecaprenyl phosphate-alpha-L-ara4FN deformylase
MQLALKINVDTFRGTLQGVPRLVDILRRHQANATFCFALGHDHSARFPSGAASSAPTISRYQRYGLAGLSNGLLLPGPDIGVRCASILKGVANAGFECAIQGWNPARWQRRIPSADGVQTEIEMRRAHERFVTIFEREAPGHAASGWIMNQHALRLTQRLGYHWASDCRGTHPFIPVWNGEIVLCPQLPTTLPTMGELLGQGSTLDNIHEAMFAHTAPRSPSQLHVLTLYADLEGILLSEKFELMLTGLREQGYELISLGQLRESLSIDALPRHNVSLQSTTNDPTPRLHQGDEFLAQWKDAA